MRKRLKDEEAELLGLEVRKKDKGRNTARYSITEDQFEIIEKYRESNLSKEISKNGQTERKPKIVEQEDSYIINYGSKGNNKVKIKKTKLSELLDLFCVARLTINKCSYKLGITRSEFFAIKTAFSITQDSVPFINDDINRMSSEELAEQWRLKKKRLALTKFEEEKYKDQSLEIDKFNRSDYWHTKLINSISKINPTKFKSEKVKYRGKEKLVFFVADIHAGLTVDSPWNEYNLSIMKERFKRLTNEIIERFEPQIISINDLGDTVHGKIHISVRKYSEDMITSTHAVIECYERMFVTLIDAGFGVEFSKVNGSHESIENGKQERTDEESIGKTIYWALKWKYSDFKNIKFIDSVNNIAILDIPGNKNIALAHGDQAGMSKLRDVRAMFPDKNIIEVNCGHIHHRKIEGFDGITVLYNECFCGTDQYAAGKLLNSDRGVRYARFGVDGRNGEDIIRL